MDCITESELMVIKQIRLLWNQHSEWTQMAVTAIVLMLPNEEQTVNRLLRNPIDFGKTLSIFYGNKIGKMFSDLLTEHLTLAAGYIKSVLAGNNAEAKEMHNKWVENAEEIAAFLGSINPYWSEAEWRDMFFVHLQLVTDIAFSLINQEYQNNVDFYDALEAEALEMADMMSMGIINQFL